MSLPPTIPIFPLPQVILVPGGLLPLHIFEARYRSMVQDALDGNRLIAMALPLSATGPNGDAPRVHPICGLGRIVQHAALPDGRSNIVLEGLERVRIERELETDKPYRLVEASAVPDVEPEGQDLSARLAGLLERIPALTERERRHARELPAGRQLDLALVRVELAIGQKYDVFAVPEVALRLEALERVVTWHERRAVRDTFEPGDPRLN